MAEAKELYDKVASIGSDKAKDEKLLTGKATLSGAAIGAVVGMYYGYAKKKNMVVMGIGGAVAGAILSRVLMPK